MIAIAVVLTLRFKITKKIWSLKKKSKNWKQELNNSKGFNHKRNKKDDTNENSQKLNIHNAINIFWIYHNVNISFGNDPAACIFCSWDSADNCVGYVD
jgi:hypothetical protein